MSNHKKICLDTTKHGITCLPKSVICFLLTFTQTSSHAAFGLTSRSMYASTLMSESSPEVIEFPNGTHHFNGWTNVTSLPPSLLRLKPKRLAMVRLIHSSGRFQALCNSPTFQSSVCQLKVQTNWEASHIYGDWSHLRLLRSLTTVDISNATVGTLMSISDNCPKLANLVCESLEWCSKEPTMNHFRNLEMLSCSVLLPVLRPILRVVRRSLQSLTVETHREESPLQVTGPGSFGVNRFIEWLSEEMNNKLETLELRLPYTKVDLTPLSTITTLETLRIHSWDSSSNATLTQISPALHTLELFENQEPLPLLEWLDTFLAVLRRAPKFQKLKISNVQTINVDAYRLFATRRFSEHINNRNVPVQVFICDTLPMI